METTTKEKKTAEQEQEKVGVAEQMINERLREIVDVLRELNKYDSDRAGQIYSEEITPLVRQGADYKISEEDLLLKLNEHKSNIEKLLSPYRAPEKQEVQAEKSAGLSQEALDLLESAKGNIPFFISKKARKILEENGIPINSSDKPEDVIQRLRERREKELAEKIAVSKEREQATKQETAAASIQPEEAPEAKVSVAEEAFEKDFAIAKNELEELTAEQETPEGKKIIRFSDLTEGQKILLLHNVKIFALENAEEKAFLAHKESEKTKYENAGRAKKAFLSYAKAFRRSENISGAEKHILKNPEEEKAEYLEILREMLSMAADGPEMSFTNGKPRFDFLSEKDTAETEEGKNLTKEFNDAADVFANIPSRLETSADEKERTAYLEARKKYSEARLNLTECLMKKFGGSEEKTAEYLANLDKKVYLTQLFNTNPDAEKDFAQIIGTKYSRWEGLKSLAKEKGKLWMMGTATRTLAATAVGVVSGGVLAVPAAVVAGASAGGVVGGYGAKKAAEQARGDAHTTGKISEKSENGFRAAVEEKTLSGLADEKETIEIGIGLTDKLEYAISRATSDGKTEEENGRAVQTLQDRLYYTEQKLATDFVAFGEGVQGAKNRYQLFNAIARARVTLEIAKPETRERIERVFKETAWADYAEMPIKRTREEEIRAKIDALWEQPVQKEKRTISEAQKRGAIAGAVIGGAAAGLISFAKDYFSHAHDAVSVKTEAPKTSAPEIFEKEPKTAGSASSQEPNLLDEMHRYMKQLSGEKHGEAAKIPEEPVVLPENKIPYPTETMNSHLAAFNEVAQKFETPVTVRHGDRVWTIVKNMFEENAEFKNLNPRQQDNVVANILKEIKNLPPEELKSRGFSGFNGHNAGDINDIYPGNKINLSGLVNENKLHELVDHASGIHDMPAPTPAPNHAIREAIETASAPKDVAPHYIEPQPKAAPVLEEISRTAHEPVGTPHEIRHPELAYHRPEDNFYNTAEATRRNIAMSEMSTRRNIAQNHQWTRENIGRTHVGTLANESLNQEITNRNIIRNAAGTYERRAMEYGYGPQNETMDMTAGMPSGFVNPAAPPPPEMYPPDFQNWVRGAYPQGTPPGFYDIPIKRQYNTGIRTITYFQQMFGWRGIPRVNQIPESWTPAQYLLYMASKAGRNHGIGRYFPRVGNVIGYGRTPQQAGSAIGTYIRQTIDSGFTRGMIGRSAARTIARTHR